MIRTLAAAAFLSVSLTAVTLANDEKTSSAPVQGEALQTEIPKFLYSEAPNDRAYGDVDADHTLIMYASNVCPHCGDWFNNEWQSVRSQLVETGKLRFVFRPLPSDPIQLSLTGFVMAECAPADDYMTVIEDQFARQATILDKAYNQTGNLREDYDAIAEVAGMETPEAITACLRDQTKMDAITLSSSRASAAEITGIPTFIFNGQIMRGDHDLKAIEGWLEGRSSQRG